MNSHFIPGIDTGLARDHMGPRNQCPNKHRHGKRNHYRVTLKLHSGLLIPGEFISGVIEYKASDQSEAEYIAREYARNFYGATVDEVTEMGDE